MNAEQKRGEDKGSTADSNKEIRLTSSPGRITIPLSDRRPVSINPDKWPIIMQTRFSWEIGVDSDSYAEIWVRACVGNNNNVRYLVYGNKGGSEPDLYGSTNGNVDWVSEIVGEYVESAELIENDHRDPKLFKAIDALAKKLELKVNLRDKLLASQEPEKLD